MEPELSTTEPQPAPWRPVNRILFRFIFAYFVLYNFPFPLNVLPYVAAWTGPYYELWNRFVPWVGKHLFHLDITVFPNGSGDTTFNYVQIFAFAALSAMTALVWSVLDRRRTQYVRLYGWLRIYVRFSLAAAMISYGSIKVIKSQFPNPSLDKLLQPFGDASPMGLLWTFMGSSQSYNVFTGLAEMLGGLLLTTRRTLLLGALLSTSVLGNIVMLNFSYDVPVKLYSAHLLAMALFLCLPELRRLANFFLLNRTAEAVAEPPLFARKELDRGALVLRAIFVAGYTAWALYGGWEGRKSYGDLAPRAALYGIWEVDQFLADGQPLQPLITEPVRWRRMVFDFPTRMGIQFMSGTRRRYLLKEDLKKKDLTLTKIEDPKWKSDLLYSQTAPGTLTIDGTFDGKKIHAMLHKASTSDFLLVNRGFHWVNEYPFNR